MKPYIGDRPLDPPEIYECEFCEDERTFTFADGQGLHEVPCPNCQHDADPGEPIDYPEDL